MNKKLLYIYGYGGSATGSTVTMLKCLMPAGYTIEAFTYTQADCATAYIRRHRSEEGAKVIIEDMMGNFEC